MSRAFLCLGCGLALMGGALPRPIAMRPAKTSTKAPASSRTARMNTPFTGGSVGVGLIFSRLQWI